MSRRTDSPDGLARLAAALEYALVSPNVADSNLEPANIVDALASLARAIHRLADAIATRPSTGDRP